MTILLVLLVFSIILILTLSHAIFFLFVSACFQKIYLSDSQAQTEDSYIHYQERRVSVPIRYFLSKCQSVSWLSCSNLNIVVGRAARPAAHVA